MRIGLGLGLRLGFISNLTAIIGNILDQNGLVSNYDSINNTIIAD